MATENDPPFAGYARNTPTTLDYFMHNYADRLEHHLAQVHG
ncbi:MAG: hypothetical protein ABJE10_05565 [bacterium]